MLELRFIHLQIYLSNAGWGEHLRGNRFQHILSEDARNNFGTSWPTQAHSMQLIAVCVILCNQRPWSREYLAGKLTDVVVLLIESARVQIPPPHETISSAFVTPNGKGDCSQRQSPWISSTQLWLATRLVCWNLPASHAPSQDGNQRLTSDVLTEGTLPPPALDLREKNGRNGFPCSIWYRLVCKFVGRRQIIVSLGGYVLQKLATKEPGFKRKWQSPIVGLPFSCTNAFFKFRFPD